MIVCDTNVVSEPMRGAKASAAVIDWLDRQPAGSLYLPAVALAELRASLRAGPSGKRLSAMHDELQRLLHGLFRGRILAFDEAAADDFGRIHARCRAAGTPGGFADIAIAATASANGFAVATRNVSDFRATGVSVVNPWERA